MVNARLGVPKGEYESGWDRQRSSSSFSLLLSGLESSDITIYEPVEPSSAPLDISAKCVFLN